MTADAYDFSGEKIQSKEWKFTTTHDMFLGLKARRFVQISFAPIGET